ncbi:uncharacterized protein JCM6883_003760 [Sporobolomyces salmoneus]|uniref:uncharacterized protein n=1 Tax=Sporobolomyces salmoneus TaxID=183962 RepID=UPI003177179C
MATRTPTRSQSIDSHDMASFLQSSSPKRFGFRSTYPRKGKGKATKETDRKAQNRIAQREFRQRKQAYIKELEAKVKLQDFGRDEQISRMGEAVKALLEENERLRQLLAGLSGFIGEGLGGALPRLKTTLPEFQSLISRSPIDIATGALRLDDLGLAGNPQNQPQTRNQDVGAELGSDLPPTHRPTQLPSQPTESLQPREHQLPSRSHSRRSSSGPTAYPDRDDNFSQHHHRPEPSYSLPPPPHRNPLPIPVPGPSHSNDREGHSFGTGNEGAAFATWCLDQFRSGNVEEADEAIARTGFSSNNNAMQAMQLISYHMKSKREHPDYILPPSLRATPTQLLVPHNAIFDGIIFPSLRDRLILLKDQYPLEELTKDLVQAIRIHGNDLLQAENWELSLDFLRKYWFVIDETILEISNKWRKERGETELDMKSIVPDTE